MSANPVTRFIKWVLLIVVSLLIILIGLVSWIYQSESGLRWTLNQVQNYLPNELSIKTIEGDLSDKLIINYPIWQQDGLSIQADKISLNCQWFDLFFKQINCTSVEVKNLNVNLLEEDATLDLAETFSGFAEFTIPISLKIKSLSADKLAVNNLSKDNILQSSLLMNQIQINSLNYSMSTFVWKQLTFEAYQHQLTASGNFNPDDQWQHHIKLAAKGPDFSFNILSKGKINQKANFQLTTESPIKSESDGFWLWKNGLMINQARITADKQAIHWLEQTIELETLQSQLDLNWPILTTNSSLKVSWQQFENIELQAKTTTSDITNWLLLSQMDINIKGDLTNKLIDQSFKDLGATAIKEYNTKINWPINIALSTSINEDIIQLKTEKIQIGALRGSLEGKIIFANETFSSLALTSEIKASNLQPLLGFPVNDLVINGKTSYQNNQWTIETKGKADTINHPELKISQLNWDIYINDHWTGELQAASVDSSGIIFSLPLLTIKGNKANHNIKLISDVRLPIIIKETSLQEEENQPMSLELDGGIVLKNTETNWHIQKLKGNLPFENIQLDLNANNIQLSSSKQQLERACLSPRPSLESQHKKDHLGEICISGEHSDKKKLINFEIKGLDISNVFDATKKHFELDYLNISGTINGHGKIAGATNKLSQLELNFDLPELKITNAESEFTWKDIRLISSNKDLDPKILDFKINLDWKEHISSYKAPNWRSSITVPDSQITLDINPKMEIAFDFKQQALSWILPYSVTDNQPVILLFPKTNVKGQLTKNKLNTQVSLQLIDNDYILANIESEWPIKENSKINGDWQLLISQLDWLKKWQNNIDKIDLKLQQQATFSGTFEKPMIKGQGELRINQLAIEEIGLDIKDSYINLTNENQNLLVNGVLKNQAGELALLGTATLYPQLSANLNLSGSNLTLIDNPENQVVVSPQITANYIDSYLKIDGKVIFDKAKIKINALPEQAITVSDDQKIVGQEANKKPTFRYKIKLDLETGSDVKFEGFGLLSDINGKLRTNIQNSKPTALNGRLNLVNATFEAYKQKLTIEEGQLLFIGPVDNPGIQFKATRIIDKIKVGIIADGSLANPRLTLYSNPVMAQENILALLLTGRSIESLSQSEGNALANAAIGLGVEGANKLAQQIGSVLGIKNMSITSKTKADSTRVDIGAQINDNLNVGYGTSINSQNEMNAGWIIEYQITPSISFEAVSGEEVSASINFKKQISSLSEEEKKN